MIPKISVVIPVYNAEKYLKQCLDSVLNSTIKDLEVICVDDGSTDNSLNILKEFKTKDKRVKIICQKNQYAGMARNNGMKIAKGEWITFIDSDDFIEIDGLEKLYIMAVENSLDFIKSSTHCLNEATQQYEKREWYLNIIAKDIFNKVTYFDEYPKILLGVNDTPWSGLYRMAFLKQHNIIFPDFYCVNDRSFFIECLLKASRVLVTDIYLVNYRISRSGSLIDRKHNHFDCQIKHYNRVKYILNTIGNEKYTKIVLRTELDQLFYWYKRLIDRNINRFKIDNLMINFCRNYDINDVGEEYLTNIYYKNIFRELRNTSLEKLDNVKLETSFRSGNILTFVFYKIRSGIRCYKEYGLRYTLKKVLYFLGLK